MAEDPLQVGAPALDKENADASSSWSKVAHNAQKTFGTPVDPNKQGTPGGAAGRYKAMVADLQGMVEELEAENKELLDDNQRLSQDLAAAGGQISQLEIGLVNEQQESEQFRAEYERIQGEGCELFKKYELKTKKLKMTQDRCDELEQLVSTARAEVVEARGMLEERFADKIRAHTQQSAAPSSQLEQALGAKEAECEQLFARVKHLEEQLAERPEVLPTDSGLEEERESLRERMQAAVEEQARALEQAEARHQASTEEALAEARAREQQLAGELAVAKEQLQQSSQAAEASGQALEALEGKARMKQQFVRSLEGELRGKQAELAKALEQLDRAHQALEMMQRNEAEAEERSAAQRAALREIELELATERQAKSTSEQAELEVLKEQLQELQEQLCAKEGSLRLQAQCVDELKQQLAQAAEHAAAQAAEAAAALAELRAELTEEQANQQAGSALVAELQRDLLASDMRRMDETERAMGVVCDQLGMEPEEADAYVSATSLSSALESSLKAMAKCDALEAQLAARSLELQEAQHQLKRACSSAAQQVLELEAAREASTRATEGMHATELAKLQQESRASKAAGEEELRVLRERLVSCEQLSASKCAALQRNLQESEAEVDEMDKLIGLAQNALSSHEAVVSQHPGLRVLLQTLGKR